MRIAILLDDAFGGTGGIAKFNRDLITACSLHPACREIVLFQRIGVVAEATPLPPKVSFGYLPEVHRRGFNVSARFVTACARHIRRLRTFDLLICCHLYLLSVSEPIARICGLRHAVVMHGVDAWSPSRHRLANWWARRTPTVISVTRHTHQRFQRWSGNVKAVCYLLPNCVDLARFTPRPRRSDLVKRLRLDGARVVFTLGRLVSTERYKGVDELLAVMPTLLQEFPDLVYVCGGSGDDLPRLQDRAARLGVGSAVRFPGFIAEEEKVDHFNLADVFVLAGWGEGFGIVLLEALACGVPVVASTLDGSREALADGLLGITVNPKDPVALQEAIAAGLARGRGIPPKALADYGFDAFCERTHRILDDLRRANGKAVQAV